MIEDRNLPVGARLVATYKKQAYVCTVEAAEEGGGVVFVLEDGKRFKSPSAAGSYVMGGKAVNGWRFWSLEGGGPRPEAEAARKGRKASGGEGAKPKAKAKGKKAKKLIYRIPSQPLTADGKSRWFCVACMDGFDLEGEEEPQACPKGHRQDDPELTGAVGLPEAEGVA